MSNLFLIRGLPGSGKTTFAGVLRDCLPNSRHFETDKYWEDAEGNYKFELSKLHAAHAFTFERVKKYLEYCYDDSMEANVIVSNTFTTEKELNPYIEIGLSNKFKVTTLIVENRHESESIHNVPFETLIKMYERFNIKL